MNGRKLASIVLLSALAVSVQGQPFLDTIVDCRSDDNCTSTTTGNFTVRDCCLGDGNLSFSFNNKCTQCIVIGWFNDTFIGEERGPPYILNADYIKGAQYANVNIAFGVEVINGTAEEGITKDYILKINPIVAEYNRPLGAPIPQVSVTFRHDGLALESKETLSLRLKPEPDDISLLSQVGVIFKDRVDLTILDNDSVQIYFSEDDFGADEGGDLNVVIIKSIATAIPVVFTITPLTIVNASASGGPKPLDSLIPPDNPFSPNKASWEDFDNSVITETFGRDDITKTVPIKTVNDTINEAKEQVFAVQLNSLDSDVDLSVRPATLCRIRDDDRIRIGFVKPEYTYLEPTDETPIGGIGTCDVEPNVVCLQKEGGVKTEQTFKIAVQRSSNVPIDDRNIQSATEGEDYRRAEVAVRTIAPDQQSINIQFDLLDDNLPETTEAFQISSSPDTTPSMQGNISHNVSTYNNPVNLFAECYVIILDNDTKIRIGFEHKEYKVYEFNKTLNVVVKVFEPAIDKSLPPRLSIRVTAQTASGSAAVGDDYKRVRDTDVIMYFNNGTRSHSFAVDITDDDIFELTENFTLELKISPLQPVAEIVQEVVTIDVLDDDDIIVGFEQANYLVTENHRTLTVDVRVTSPSDDKELPATVSLNVLTVSGTATGGGVDYTFQDVILTFNNVTRTASFNVDIADDDLFEVTENFSLKLMLLNSSTSRVVIKPELATVNIQDDDDIIIGFENTNYLVFETAEMLTVVARVTSPLDDEELPASVSLNVLTVPGTATDRDDYMSLSGQDAILVFDNDTRTVSFDVDITNDNVFEVSENFTLELMLLDSSTTDRVIIDPEEATIDILDADDIVIGFDQTRYTVIESAGILTVVVKVSNPSSDKEIPATVSLNALTVPGTATGDGVDYTNQDVILMFDDDSRTASFDVVITNDTLAEFTESFSLNLVLDSSTSDRVVISPEEATVDIMDDDTIVIGFEQTSYTVNESIGTLDVVVRVINPPDDKELPTTVSLNVLTVNGTATGGDDYDELDADDSASLLTFDDAVRIDTVSVTIIDDELMEPSTENFTVVLQRSSVGPLNVTLKPSTATINIEDDDDHIIIHVNDTIIGDPLFSVPILVSEDDLKMIGPKLSLCYEVHGARDKIYNMITDECASVNAHYNDLSSFLNVIDRVGVRATDNKGRCKNIQVDVEGCVVSIDGFPVVDKYYSEGISVRKYNNRVRIAVPNCNELSLVMWVICEIRTLDDPKNETNKITGDMIKLVVTRGLNFGHRKAHGLIGQFWNIPVSVTPYEGNDTDGNPVEQVFVVNITTNGASHGYAGHLYHMTWDRQMTPCLYVGNRQAGPIHEIPYPNDYVIEGNYESYAVPSLFTEDKYGYSLFNEKNCLDLPTAATTP